MDHSDGVAGQRGQRHGTSGRMVPWLLVLLFASAGSCAGASSPKGAETTTVTAAPTGIETTTVTAAAPPASSSATTAGVSLSGLPPGALNPDVTEATIGSTICVRGWTATVRPPEAYTEALKRRQLVERRLPGSPADYEEDHFIPLELGGAPRDPANLWPEPRSGPPPVASDKDAAEGRLHRAVCSGALTLDAARSLIRDPGQWHG